jgi:eukaryotic-like serine/threonine-protein kinase
VLAMMQSRIGRLPASVRRVLRAASVFGETAGQGGIHALLGGSMSDQEIDGWLALLLREEIVEELRFSRFLGEKAYRFHHALVRDAAYSLSSEEERSAWHRLAGEHLEARGEPDSLVLAEHFVQGGEPLRAVPYYLRAGEESYEANDLTAAFSSAKRGLSSGAGGELRGALLSLEVMAYFWRWQFAEVIALGTEALDLLPHGTRRWCRCFQPVWVAAYHTGQTALLAELTSRFERVEPSADARGEYAQGAAWCAAALGARGMKEASRRIRERARQSGAAAGPDDLLVWGPLHTMDAYDHVMIEESPWSCMIRFAEAADAFRAVGKQRHQLLMRVHHGRALHHLGDLTGAEAELRETLAQSERLGEGFLLTAARVHLASLLVRTVSVDRLDEPEQLAHDLMSAENPTLMAIAHVAIAEIKYRQGDLVGAEREAHAGCEAMRPFPGVAWGIIALHARILLEQRRAEESLAVAEAGVRELERLGVEGNGEIDLRLSLAEALHAVGRPEAAHAALADILPRLKKRLDDIPEPSARKRYLTNVRANARVVALAEAWLGDEALRALGPL